MMLRMAEVGRRRSLAADAGQKKRDPTQLRNEAQLNCVALRSELDCEVTWGAVKGQDERPLSGTPLTAPKSPPEVSASRKRN
jgi:hypothetical protein